jgi:peptidoglycan/LPS O-acetylase OafA/YrhL
MQPTFGNARLDSLTGLRYCAAMTVVISHVVGNIPELRSTVLSNLSGIGMPLFFTLSGFLMCYNYYAEFAEGRPGALRRFYVARFARIYPVYLLVLLLSFSFMGNFFHDVYFRPAETARCLAFCGTLTQSWVHLPAFADYLNPRTVTQAYLGISWSVSTEIFFYATFPLVIPVLKRLTTPKRILGCAAAVWCAYAAFDLWYTRGIADFWRVVTGFSTERWVLYLSPYGRVGEFWIGCLAGRLYGVASLKPASIWESRCARLAMWCSGPLLIILVRKIGHNWYADRLFINIGLAPLCVAVIYGLARCPSFPQRLLASRPLVLLGESSYCLFLLHPLFQSFYHPRVLGEEELKQWYFQVYNHAAMFFMLHVGALGIHQFFELPLRTKIRHWLSPVRQAPPTVVREPQFVPAERRAA